MDRRFLIGGGAAAAVVVIAGGGYVYSTSQPAEAQTQVTPGSADSTIDTSSVVEMTMGSDDAPITLVEYASFTCPHCASFHHNVFPQLKANYIDTGKVKFVYRDVYFDRPGLWAAMLARCAGPMRFFGMASMYYEQQDQWLRTAETNAQAADNLRRIAKVAGMDDETINACLADEDMARTLAAWYQTNATEDDVTGTPTLIIDGEKHSNMSYTDLAAILDEKLG